MGRIMKSLKEIQIGNKQVTLNGNRVKSSILPKASNELERDLICQGDVVIEGAVFSRSIDVTGGEVYFEGAVFANKEIHMNSDIEGIVYFKKAVASVTNIISWLDSSKAYFGADVNADKVRLKNCFVAANIFAKDVELENCVVLGGVFATSSLKITNSIVGTFHSQTVMLAQTNYLLLPTAFSIEPIDVIPGSSLRNISLVDFGAIYRGEELGKNTGAIELNLAVDSRRTILKDEQGNQQLLNSYSVSAKVLATDLIDFEKLDNQFLLSVGSLGGQLLKKYSWTNKDGESKELTQIEIADFFFDILIGKYPLQEINANIEIDELRKQFF
jgi:hypothetical protein